LLDGRAPAAKEPSGSCGHLDLAYFVPGSDNKKRGKHFACLSFYYVFLVVFYSLLSNEVSVFM